MFYFNSHGWLSLQPIEGRSVSITPPEHGDTPVVGQPWPNYTGDPEPGKEWEMKNYTVPQAPAVPAINYGYKMTKLAFRTRFTSNEKVAIEMASLDDPTASLTNRKIAASLRATLADQRDAKYIDVSLQSTRVGVMALEALGLIGVGRALVILDTLLTEAEQEK